MADYGAHLVVEDGAFIGVQTGASVYLESLAIVEQITVSPTETAISFSKPLKIANNIPVVSGSPAYTVGTAILSNPILTLPVSVAPVLLTNLVGDPVNGLYLTFNSDVGIDPGVGLTSPVMAGWTFDSVFNESATQLRVSITDTPPTVLSAEGGPFGLNLTFDLPLQIGEGGVSILNPIDEGWDFNNTSLNDPTVLNVDIFDVPAPVVTGITIASLVSKVRSIEITFTDSLIVDAPGLQPQNWAIRTSMPGAVQIAVKSVSVVGNKVTLVTTEATDGKTYTLTPPATAIHGSSGDVYTTPATIDFTAKGDKPSVILTRAMDDNTLDVIFNEDVTTKSASNRLNYNFAPPLQVTQVQQLSQSEYRLTLAGKKPSQVYVLSVSNIADVANNSI